MLAGLAPRALEQVEEMVAEAALWDFLLKAEKEALVFMVEMADRAAVLPEKATGAEQSYNTVERQERAKKQLQEHLENRPERYMLALAALAAMQLKVPMITTTT